MKTEFDKLKERCDANSLRMIESALNELPDEFFEVIFVFPVHTVEEIRIEYQQLIDYLKSDNSKIKIEI